MPEQRTAPEGEQWFTWTVVGESYRPGSNPAYRSEDYKSAIMAESAGEALEKIVTGLGEGTTGDNTIPWDLIEQDREITITIKPAELCEENGCEFFAGHEVTHPHGVRISDA